MRIRPAITKDAQGIFFIQKITWADAYPSDQYNIKHEDILQKFADKDKRITKIKEKIEQSGEDKYYRVAIENEKIVGFLSSLQEDEKMTVSAIYVLPEYQGRGIGKALLKKALKFYKNSKEIWLEVADYNQNAINFYQKHGFQIVPGTEGQYQIVKDKYIPTIKMKREQ